MIYLSIKWSTFTVGSKLLIMTHKRVLRVILCVYMYVKYIYSEKHLQWVPIAYPPHKKSKLLNMTFKVFHNPAIPVSSQILSFHVSGLKVPDYSLLSKYNFHVLALVYSIPSTWNSLSPSSQTSVTVKFTCNSA